ncbi:MAG: ArsR/SmtB family transcription factor [Cytophagaceae bacterium]
MKDKREFKDKLFGELARISGALSNARRLEIIDLLCQGEKTVEKISVSTNMSIANTSQHLQVLKAGNLVEIRREGNFIFYRISDEKVIQIWNLLRLLGTERMAEIEKVVKDFRSKKEVFESINIDQLLLKMKEENVMVIDVRPEDEFLSGHIKGAVSIPIDQLESRLKLLPKNQKIVAYCRGPFCVFADEAVQILKKKKFSAIRLEEGFADWKLKGLPVVVK